jgi:ubiquitin conjugation factor E4 A
MCTEGQNTKLDYSTVANVLAQSGKPISAFNRYLLSLVPEFFLSNLTQHLVFLNRFKNNAIHSIFNVKLDEHAVGFNSLIILITLFMGSPKFLVNPHCRAALAECLETLLPNHNNKHTEVFFLNHMCAPYLTESLLNVFVSIEMTGQSVQFEQKFNYRRPMYEILEYLWSIDLHRKKIEVRVHLTQVFFVNDPY